MARPAKRKLTLFRRGKIWYVEARDPVSGRVLQMSLREKNAALAAARHEELEEKWQAGEKIFPRQLGGGEAFGLAEAVENFVAWRTGQVADSTLGQDRKRLRLFARGFKGRPVNRVTRADADAFLSDVRSRKAGQTYNHYLHSLRLFFRWAMDRSLIHFDPTKGQKTVKVPTQPVVYLDKEERAKVIKAVKGHKHEAAVAVALGCGLRRGELERFDPKKDFDAGLKQLLVRKSKSGKPRSVPVPGWVQKMLKEKEYQPVPRGRATRLARVNYFPGWRQLFFGYPFCFLPPLPPGGGPHCA